MLHLYCVAKTLHFQIKLEQNWCCYQWSTKLLVAEALIEAVVFLLVVIFMNIFT